MLKTDLNTSPPSAPSPPDNRTTLIFSWFATGLVAVVIVTRLVGRKLRANAVFREDVIMALALLPLFTRMGLVHVILEYGTNNTVITGLTVQDVHRREVGSRLVLASRIFYAMFIWLAKMTASEFLKRVTSAIWTSTYEAILHVIRIFLLLTFVAVVISTLGECQPFDHYWQVVPDPGPSCRTGYAQLITMGVCDIFTDVLLMALPVPLILRSHLVVKQKVMLVALFSSSILLIAITGSRVPEVIKHGGSQQYRTLWATCEILASAAVVNAVVLGSFLRDKGIKRNRYQPHAGHGGLLVGDESSSNSKRRYLYDATGTLGSDEDLFAAIGCRMPADLKYHRSDEEVVIVKPAPVVPPLHHAPNIEKPVETRVNVEQPDRRPDTPQTEATGPPMRRPRMVRIDTSPTVIARVGPDDVDFLQSAPLVDAGRLLGDQLPATHTPATPMTPSSARRNRRLSALRSPRSMAAISDTRTPSPSSRSTSPWIRRRDSTSARRPGLGTLKTSE